MNLYALDNATTGFAGVFAYSLHVRQFSSMFLIVGAIPVSTLLPPSDSAADDLAQLKAEVAWLCADMNMMKQEMIATKHENNILKREVDRLEQYGRHHSVVIRGIPAVENETTAELTEKVKHILRTALSITSEFVKDFEKTHRIGKVFETEEGERRQDVILRMKSHSARYNIYDTRKKSKNKPHHSPATDPNCARG